MLLYAQWPATIGRLTVDHVHTSDEQVRIRLGDEPIVLPEPLASLALHVVASRRGKAALGDPGTSPWLFPGGQPGRPLSAFGPGERLRKLGLHPGQARSTALFQLATDLPAAVLAKMLGIHISVAVAWQRASSGDWMAYAADISRRTPEPAICALIPWHLSNDKPDTLGLGPGCRPGRCHFCAGAGRYGPGDGQHLGGCPRAHGLSLSPGSLGAMTGRMVPSSASALSDTAGSFALARRLRRASWQHLQQPRPARTGCGDAALQGFSVDTV